MFKVFLKRSAAKFLAGLDKHTKERLLSTLKILETNPVPFSSLDVKKLKGYDDFLGLE